MRIPRSCAVSETLSVSDARSHSVSGNDRSSEPDVIAMAASIAATRALGPSGTESANPK
jgi:hypothetical protein